MTTMAPSTVRFARRSTRGVLLGFSALRCEVIGVAFVVLLIGLLLAGGWGLMLTSPLWTALAVSAFLRRKGKTIIEWLPIVLHWSLRISATQTEYRMRVTEPRPAGTMALPGDAASLHFYDDPETGACFIHDPHRETLSVVLSVSHSAYVLLAPGEQNQRVSAWGRVLASLAQTGTCAAVQVLESTIPDPGTKVAQWYEEHATRVDDWANGEYQRLLAQSSFGSSTHRTTITLSLDMKKAAASIRAAGRGVRGAVHVLRVDMTVLEQGLRAAGLRLGGWQNEQQLAALLRQAYDPSSEVDVRTLGARLKSAGPIAVSEHWSYLRHDSGYSCVLWISEWPRIEVPAHFLHALVFAPDIRKSLSLIARPLGTAEALRALRKEKTEAITDSRHKAKVGQVQDLSDVQEYQDLLAREQALIGGHADVEFSGFFTVISASRDGLTQAVALIERAAGQSGCETRVLYGRQSQGFVVGALPLGRRSF
ncbi:MAG: SCO6880 family protein [Acidimicrobiales bacterium]